MSNHRRHEAELLGLTGGAAQPSPDGALGDPELPGDPPVAGAASVRQERSADHVDPCLAA